MHPLLATRGRILLYLAGWIPILALLDYLMWASGGAGWDRQSSHVGIVASAGMCDELRE